jgi:hypothetical protein
VPDGCILIVCSNGEYMMNIKKLDAFCKKLGTCKLGDDLANALTLSPPYLALWGEDDNLIPMENMPRLIRSIDAYVTSGSKLPNNRAYHALVKEAIINSSYLEEAPEESASRGISSIIHKVENEVENLLPYIKKIDDVVSKLVEKLPVAEQLAHKFNIIALEEIPKLEQLLAKVNTALDNSTFNGFIAKLQMLLDKFDSLLTLTSNIGASNLKDLPLESSISDKKAFIQEIVIRIMKYISALSSIFDQQTKEIEAPVSECDDEESSSTLPTSENAAPSSDAGDDVQEDDSPSNEDVQNGSDDVQDDDSSSNEEDQNGSSSDNEDADNDPAPVDNDPAPVDPAPVDPAPVDPAPVDSSPVDPALVDPAPAQVDPSPAQVDPAPAQVDPAPAQVDPAPAQVDPSPAQADPSPAQVDPAPAQVDPTLVDPASAPLAIPMPQPTPVPQPVPVPQPSQSSVEEMIMEVLNKYAVPSDIKKHMQQLFGDAEKHEAAFYTFDIVFRYNSGDIMTIDYETYGKLIGSPQATKMKKEHFLKAVMMCIDMYKAAVDDNKVKWIVDITDKKISLLMRSK